MVRQIRANKTVRVDLYFENFTAFSLFQQPTFEVKAQNVPSSLHLHALLAAMFSFAAPFLPVDSYSPSNIPDPDNPVIPNAERFAELAEKFVQESLAALADDTPPLCLLQALILTTYRKLIKGARGRAWRSLGTCVRLGYEMNLHLVDSEGLGRADGLQSQNRDQWVADEERRRAWWAIWEMDIFAGTVRRCPAAIDWSQNETYLPVDDEAFFTGVPKKSCYLERNAIDRWKALHESGNDSPKAWFIVVNSLMREAQMLASPRGVPMTGLSDTRATSTRNGFRMLPGKASKDVSEKLGAISNALRCFSLTLPPAIKYRNQFLNFESTGPDDAKSPRRVHSSIYSIHLMTALAKLMIHHYYVFSVPPDCPPATSADEPQANPKERPGSSSYQYRPSGLALDQYFEAADEILTIINRCNEEHVRYVNPFLASTVWLAAAAQLVAKVFGSPNTDANLARSKFEVLYLLHKEFVNYWGISTALQENLNTLGARLDRISVRLNGEDDGARPTFNGQSQRHNGTSSLTNNGPQEQETQPGFDANHASPNLYHIPRSELPPFSSMAHLHLAQPDQEQQGMQDFSNGIGNIASYAPPQQNDIIGSMEDTTGFGTGNSINSNMIDELDFNMSLDMSESELQGYLGGVLSGALIG